MFMMVDYVREMTVKKSCKYGKYGMFEHLLFSFINMSDIAIYEIRDVYPK